jgi:hypothetical protein
MRLPRRDWPAGATFHILVAPSAAAKFDQLTLDAQIRLRAMMDDVAQVAENAAVPWPGGTNFPLLSLQLGRVNVRYSIHMTRRAITIEHVIVPEELERAG